MYSWRLYHFHPSCSEISLGQTTEYHIKGHFLVPLLAYLFAIIVQQLRARERGLHACRESYRRLRLRLAYSWIRLGTLSKCGYCIVFCIRRRIHKFYWFVRIRGCLWVGRSSLWTLLCMRGARSQSQEIVCLCQRSLQGTSSLLQEGSRHIRKALEDLETGHGHRLYLFLLDNDTFTVHELKWRWCNLVRDQIFKWVLTYHKFWLVLQVLRRLAVPWRFL